MTTNPPLRLLAIDPGLAHVGFAVCDVAGYANVRVLGTQTITTEAHDSLATRLAHIRRCLQNPFHLYAPTPTHVVIEDPTTTIQSSRAGQRKDPRNLYKLVAAYGSILNDLTRELRPEAITTPSVQGWYPKAGRGKMGKDAVLEGLRRRYASQLPTRVSEHVVMALGLADWWSTQVAPKLWFGLTQRAPKLVTS